MQSIDTSSAAAHWAERLAAARAAHPTLTTGEYLRHVLLDIVRDTGELGFAEEVEAFYAFNIKSIREAVLAGQLLDDCIRPDPLAYLLTGPAVGNVLSAYEMFSYRNKRYRCPTFDIGLGEEENPDSYESWAGFAEAVLALAATAEAEANS